ncbi:D-alanyl-D-alanine carboxypeptidase/D-alanyl-D-alanine endopeptidase [Aestuariimicrobium ganziense]|uniref:D-alanyl-D-alanine carboxypeptidase/D-alanyl-D-alanine endopeptidase n=1 Tax=Aestuariimicrobium ganziense TaxID=2773677 RepID=UPI002E2AAA6A|nr:D-alanyl-D-alanine carboxypeptidase/D-alanyl-D-alanine-endopeptidase [Aestuariimicrobium ganziense]
MSRADGRRGPLLGLSVLAMVTTVIIIGLIVGGGPLLNATSLRVDGGRPSIEPSLFAPPTPTPLPSATGDGVIDEPDPATPSASVVPASLSAKLKAVPREHGGTNAVLVIDPATGTPLYSENAATSMIPASNMKTLVALAVLEELGPDAEFTTSVSLQGTRVVLRGGGDPYLSQIGHPALQGGPTLVDLATQTATALKAAGVTTVTLAVDDTLFTGPAWNPAWPTTYGDQVTPISALMVDGGRVLDAQGRPVVGAPRAKDAALDAGTRFIALLTERGIKVNGKPTRAKAAGTQIAEVTSLPLEVLVTRMMVISDNTAAEVLLRQLALGAGKPGSFVGGAQALQQQLTALKIWRKGAVIQDGSGLSRGNRVSAEMLGAAWLRVSSTESVRGLLVATPVAGVSGTLRDRFFNPDAKAGRGWVHAKTGTLREVSSLSGWTVTADGQPVVLVLIVNNSKNDWFARTWIDASASAITGCGCR